MAHRRNFRRTINNAFPNYGEPVKPQLSHKSAVLMRRVRAALPEGGFTKLGKRWIKGKRRMDKVDSVKLMELSIPISYDGDLTKGSYGVWAVVVQMYRSCYPVRIPAGAWLISEYESYKTRERVANELEGQGFESVVVVCGYGALGAFTHVRGHGIVKRTIMQVDERGKRERSED